jgi:hypothetical protein
VRQVLIAFGYQRDATAGLATTIGAALIRSGEGRTTREPGGDGCVRSATETETTPP